MTEQERKDAALIRAASRCLDDKNCFSCVYDDFTDCKGQALRDLLGVIDRKDKRIEELEERIAIMTEGKEQTDDGLPITW